MRLHGGSLQQAWAQARRAAALAELGAHHWHCATVRYTAPGAPCSALPRVLAQCLAVGVQQERCQAQGVSQKMVAAHGRCRVQAVGPASAPGREGAQGWVVPWPWVTIPPDTHNGPPPTCSNAVMYSAHHGAE